MLLISGLSSFIFVVCLPLDRPPTQGGQSQCTRHWGRDKQGFHRRATLPYILQYLALSAHACPHVATCCHILPHLPTFIPVKAQKGESRHLQRRPRLSRPRLEAGEDGRAARRPGGRTAGRRPLGSRLWFISYVLMFCVCCCRDWVVVCSPAAPCAAPPGPPARAAGPPAYYHCYHCHYHYY